MRIRFIAVFALVLASLCETSKLRAAEVDTANTGIGYFVTTVTPAGGSSRLDLYKMNATGVATQVHEDIFPGSSTNGFSASDYSVNTKSGKIYFLEPASGSSTRRVRTWDIETETFEGYTDIDGLPSGGSPMFIEYPTTLDDLVKKTCTTEGSSCAETDPEKVALGGEGSAAVAIIDSDGISTGGKNLVKRVGDVLHIGENSLVTVESGGRQKLYATDANGDAIDIDITNGSRLLINGRDVEKSIDNVGALSAALGSVPTISADSKVTCGLGGGTHSSAYAVSGGCASKVSERISLNAAVATVFNNHTGDFDDNLSARAGFTFRLGKIDDSPKVAARKAAELRDEVAKLREENKAMRAESFTQQQINASLLARLERLERIASGQLSLMGDRALND